MKKAIAVVLAGAVIIAAILVFGQSVSNNYVSGIATGQVNIKVLPGPPAAPQAPPTGGGGSISAGIKSSGGGGGSGLGKTTKIKEPSLEVLVQIVEGYEEIAPGESFLVTIRITNFNLPKYKDTFLSYAVVDANENQITVGEETITIETAISIVRKINLPLAVGQGAYKLRVTASYNGETAIGNAIFGVRPTFGAPTALFFAGKPVGLQPAVIVAFAAGVLATFAYLNLRKNRKFRKAFRV